MWTFTPSSSLPPNITVAPNGTGIIVEYAVQNQSKRQISLTMQPIAGVSQTTNCDLTPKGSAGSSCLLRLFIDGSLMPANGLRGGPIMCSKNGNGSPNPAQCYRPGSTASTLDVHIAPTPLSWVTNDSVYAVALDNNQNRVYIGGRFTQVGPNTGAWVPVSKISATPTLGLARFAGVVMSSVSDNQGGWYVGGEFDSVGGYQRNNLAHILADGTVDPSWNPNVNDQIRSVLLVGNTLYIGGKFTQVGGQARNYIASLNASDGSLTGWNPSANNYVYSFAIDNSRLYIGGRFTSIAGQARGYLAAFDSTNGNIDPNWNPNLNDTTVDGVRGVHSIVVNNNIVYAAGYYDQVNGGVARMSLAAFNDSGSGIVTTWNPNPNDFVTSLKLSNGILYFGGRFTSVGGQVRNLLAAVDLNGNLTPWAPEISGSIINSILTDSNTIYVGGYFNTVNTNTTPVARSNLAAFDLSGVATVWNPIGSGQIWGLANDGQYIRVGGDFSTINAQTRNGLAALDATTSQLLDWNPDVLGNVYALALNGNELYIGGAFNALNNGSVSRNNLASVDTNTGLATSWNPDADSIVYSMTKNSSNLFVGGNFTTIGGQSRKRIAAFVLNTNTLNTAWGAEVDDPFFNPVYAIIADDNNVYFGGNFSSVNGQPRGNVAKVSATNGSLDMGWTADTDSNVLALALSDKLYIGGTFSMVGVTSRNRLAAVSPSNGQVDNTWVANTNDSVRSLLLSADTLYVGGDFSSIGGEVRFSFAALNASTAAIYGGTPAFTATFFNPTVRAIAANGSNLYLGGDFTAVGYNAYAFFSIVAR